MFKRGEGLSNSRVELLLDIFERQLPEEYNSKDIRTSQVQMAIDVAEFLHTAQRSKRILVVEAPVGTGKSLGALVPALIECSIDRAFNQNRVVYATATINLQSQLMQSEVPLLKKMKLLKTAILAKGKSHYYCHHEKQFIKQLDNELSQKLDQFFKTSSTGHRDEFEKNYGGIGNSDWNRVSFKGSRSDCERCSLGFCPTANHRKRFRDEHVDLVVTNQDQLIRSVLNRLEDEPTAAIVPLNPGIIVIDEAHHFLENFLGMIADSTSTSDLAEVARSWHFPEDQKVAYNNLILELNKAMRREAQDKQSLLGRYPISSNLSHYLAEVRNTLKTLSEKIFFSKRERLDRDSSLRDYVEKLDKIVYSIKQLINSKYSVSWLTYEDSTFTSIPTNFPSEFKRVISHLAGQNKLIVMSGTLSMDGDFTSFLNQWRLSREDVELKVIPESFQYQIQSLIYVPENIPHPNDQEKDLMRHAMGHYRQLLELTQGSSLLLSTSKQYMASAREPIEQICQDNQWLFLYQEQAGVEQLTSEFKADKNSVLLGSGSYFSGFSVPGEGLVSVIFSRLPFPVPDDPFIKLIGQGFEDDFMKQVTLPHMMVKLNQGVGRLIRDIKDYGVITILDPRIFTQEYGRDIQKSFEEKGYRFTRSFEEVQAFFQEKRQHGSQAAYPPYSRSALNISERLNTGKVVFKGKEIAKELKISMDQISDEQKKYAKAICKQYGFKFSTKPKTGEDLFRYLVNQLYVAFKSFAHIAEEYPFKDQEQWERLSKYQGDGKRSYQMLKCTDPRIGCSGVCGAEQIQALSQRVMDCGGELVPPITNRGFCWLEIKPHDLNEEILSRFASLVDEVAATEEQ